MAEEYEVIIYETISHRATVVVDSEDDAYEAAYNIITGEVKGEYDTEPEGFTGLYYINATQAPNTNKINL